MCYLYGSFTNPGTASFFNQSKPCKRLFLLMCVCVCMCVHMCMYMCMCMCDNACGSQKRVLDPLELELQEVVSHRLWVLGEQQVQLSSPLQKFLKSQVLMFKTNIPRNTAKCGGTRPEPSPLTCKKPSSEINLGARRPEKVPDAAPERVSKWQNASQACHTRPQGPAMTPGHRKMDSNILSPQPHLVSLVHPEP